MRILADGLAPLQTGLVARLEAMVDRFNLESRTLFNVRDEEYGAVGDGVAIDGPAIMAAYTDAAVAGGTVVIPAGTYKYSADMNWTSNNVSVLGAGSGPVVLQASGTPKILIRPTTFTVTQGPRIGGFTVRGASGSPASAIGIKTGDITSFAFDDIVVENFTGTGSIGIWVDTEVQTEINTWNRIHLNNNKVGIKWTNPNPTLNSLARNNFHRCHINVYAGQVGWQMRNNGNLYTSVLNITGNMGDAGTFFDIGDTATINGCFIDIGMEQTSGTGGTPYVVAATAFVFGYGVARFENFAAVGTITGGARHTPGWRIMGPEALVVGVDSAAEGTLTNFLGSGNPANVHPLLWDSAQDPYATIGFMTGANIRAPFVTMFDANGSSAFIIYKIGSGAPNNLAEVARFTPAGHLVFSGGAPPTATNQTALGTAPPAATTSGNAMKGTLSLGTGTSPAAGFAARVTFATAWPVLPEIVLQPLTALSHDPKPYVVRATTHFDVYFAVAPLASQSAGTYAWAFHAMG